MASVRLDQNGDCVDNMLVEHLLPLDSSDACDDFGEPVILPRIGDDYQLEIPPSIEKSLYTSYTRNSADAQNGVHSHHNFFIGLPIPVVWINPGGRCMKQDTWEEPKIASNFSSSEVNSIKESENLPTEDKFHQSCNRGYFLVLGLPSDYWNDIEKDSFLLGLYIFEKNFVQLRQFIESKEIGAILSFYYGKFYGSENYCRWSEGRKVRNKRCVHGQKIFSGLRQEELISRILPSMSEECQNALVEVSKSFGEGKLSLQDYVSSLKAMVGIKVLIQTIAIGKGKQDLTRMALETSRSNQVVAMHPEIPTGQAWSSLTASEVIKFLTGDYRLSKARSNDLFWEAVWPRLLARGWHSEQPKDQSFIAGLKHGLVFLIPGVRKFSRRKLVKGDHYFDSVSDVLSKVAKEPELLEIEAEEDYDNKEQDDHHLPTAQHHCYLQPRTPNRNSDIMKFTVVDTSLTDGKPYKLKELRSLPFEISSMLTLQNCSKVSDEESSDEITDESDSVNTMHVDSGETDNASIQTTKFNGEMLPGRKDLYVNGPYQDIHTISPDVDNMLLSSLKNKKYLHLDKRSRKVVNSRLCRKQKQENVDIIAPITKRRRELTPCSCEETRNGLIHSSRVLGSENKISSCFSGIHELSECTSIEVGSSHDKLSSTIFLEGSPIGNVECTPNRNVDAAEAPLENPQTQISIDLNFPQVPPDLENGFLATESQNSSATEASYKQKPSMNMRRHSTRNRPPTIRALEALANGFLTANRRRSKNSSS